MTLINWNPRRSDTEVQYQTSLAQFLRRELPGANVAIERPIALGHGNRTGRLDLVVDETLVIELLPGLCGQALSAVGRHARRNTGSGHGWVRRSAHNARRLTRHAACAEAPLRRRSRASLRAGPMPVLTSAACRSCPFPRRAWRVAAWSWWASAAGPRRRGLPPAPPGRYITA